ncbi:MAG: ROK family protein [Verrucomicrobiota bacterium]|nr:ROK family protein [Verrucomicrobiota bacterium]
MLPITMTCPPPLDPGFIPASLWHLAYTARVTASAKHRPLVLALEQTDGIVSHFRTVYLPGEEEVAALNLRNIERHLKFLLWQRGAFRVHLFGDATLTRELAALYCADGLRAFDHHFMGQRVYRQPFEIVHCARESDLPAEKSAPRKLGGHWDGCRVGFDLGGSDRKFAAVMDGKIIHTGEVKWSPYFNNDPAYHIAGIRDCIVQAAAYLPRVDAIGGSAAGVYVDNEPRVASLFRGLSEDAFEKHIRPCFHQLQKEWNGVPLEVANDGEVTALAGAMTLGQGAVLGLSLGTSTAGGYVTPDGSLTPWLNELAFVPFDYSADAPIEEWSGDRGCGASYFSQQAVGRLAIKAGIELSETMPLAEKLEQVQALMSRDDPRARRIFETIGTWLGYGLAHLSTYYDYRHCLILGRVTSGNGGELILSTARTVLQQAFPEIAATLTLHLPDESSKRHGQAVAAASLPQSKK